jgi:hypothetical protein
MPHRLTWLAIVLTFVFLAPGEFIGYVCAYLYKILVAGWAFHGDTVFDALTRGWFSRLGLDGISSLAQGMIAGFLAAVFCARITRIADFRIVAYANAAAVVAFTALAWVGNYPYMGTQINGFALLSNTAGLVFGLIIAAEHIREKQGDNPAAAKPAAKS